MALSLWHSSEKRNEHQEYYEQYTTTEYILLYDSSLVQSRFLSHDFLAESQTFITDIDATRSQHQMLNLLLLLATKGTLIFPSRSCCRMRYLLSLRSIIGTEMVYTFIAHIDPTRACDEAQYLILVLTTERTQVRLVDSLPVLHISPFSMILLYRSSGYTHIIDFKVFAHVPTDNMDVVDIVVERKHEVLYRITLQAGPHTERTMLAEVEKQQLIGINDT